MVESPLECSSHRKFCFVIAGGGPVQQVHYTPVEMAMLPFLEITAIHGLQDVPESQAPSTSKFLFLLSFVYHPPRGCQRIISVLHVGLFVH